MLRDRARKRLLRERQEAPEQFFLGLPALCIIRGFRGSRWPTRAGSEIGRCVCARSSEC